ncbi:hypothetical protein LINPERHAP1_LOCUS15895 [Linum perenne]
MRLIITSIRVSSRHEPVARNGSSIGALQLPESRIEAKGFLVFQIRVLGGERKK